MSNALQLLVNLDQDAVRVTSELRCGPATGVLELASAWWVKGPLLTGGMGELPGDVRPSRAREYG